MTSSTASYRGVLELSSEEFRVCATNSCKVMTPRSESASFVVPLALITRLSSNLGALVKSELDSTEVVLSLEAVDDDTLLLFFQFVLSGTYESPRHCRKGGSNRVGCADDTANHSVRGAPQNICGASGTASDGGPFGAPPKPVALTGGGLFGTNPLVAPPARNTPVAAQRLSKSISPYSLVSKTTVLDSYSGPKVSYKRKRVTSDDGEDIGRYPDTQQHCISLFLKKYGIDEHKLQANGIDGTASMRATVSESFLSHCRMWHFACTYAVPTLMDYACSQLALALAHFVIRATSFVPVFKRLVQFVYKKCDIQDSSLRLLIAGFAACVIEDVSGLEAWRGLLTDVPAFRSDLADELLHAMETPQTARPF